MGLRDRINAQRQKTAQPAPTPPPTQPEATAQPTMPKACAEPVQPTEIVTWRCGHTEPVKAFAGAICPKCRVVSRKNRGERRAKAQQAKREDHGRLPHGANFSVQYDAAKKSWHGNLCILAVDGSEPQFFSGEASGVFKLLSLLDSKYREWLVQQPKGKE